MRIVIFDCKWSLLLLLLTICILNSEARRGGGGRGGGGSRGGSRGGSSRGSSTSRGSSSSSGRGTVYDRARDRGRTDAHVPSAPAPQPKAPEAPRPKAPAVQQPAHNPNYKEPSVGNKQPAQNPNYKEPGAGNQQPPPYSPRERPPPYSPNAPQQGPPPPYNPSGGAAGQGSIRGQPPAYPGGSSYPGANYPRQPGSNVPGSNQAGANYPRQPGSNIPGSSQAGANYPRQPGSNYPQQGGGIPAANYPRQPAAPAYVPHQPMGSNVWRPQSNVPAPSYMNSGGIPTGMNMAGKPYKNKGLLGSVMTMGAASQMGRHNKYYGSYPSPYGMGGMSRMGGMNSFLGNRGSRAAMYTILPLMAMGVVGASLFRPRFGYMPMFYPSPFYHSHYYGHGYGYGHRSHYDVYNNEYAGRCNRPIEPANANVQCNSTYKEIDCDVTCKEGYLFPDNTTKKENKCWHVGGVWRPEKNFPDCKPVCNRTCLNGGSCAAPDICGCPPEYRGPNCEFYFLQCDIRKLAAGKKIRWVCTHFKNESVCKVHCEEGEFVTPMEQEYRCTTEGVWTPNYIPQCTRQSGSDNTTTVEGTSQTQSPVTIAISDARS